MRDATSFDEFYRSTSRRMLRYGYAVVGDHAEAQDLVQEAYARAWRQWGRLTTHPAPEAWLRLVIARLATDRWRRLHGWRSMLSRTGPPEPVPPPSEDGVLLAGALRRLPAAQRQALALHYLVGAGHRPGDPGAHRHREVLVGTGRARLAALLPDLDVELEANDVA